MKKSVKRFFSLILSMAMLICTMPLEVLATEDMGESFLPEAEIGEDILENDVFYLGSTSASVPENGNNAYLIKVGRGGTADSESVALVKIADMTAKYGRDYVVQVHGERTKVNNPRDNQSLKEKIEGSDFDQNEAGTEEEFAEKMEDDPEAAKTYKEGVESAVDYLEEASGLKDKYGDDNPYSDEVAKMYSQDQNNDTSDENSSDEAASDGVVPADGKEEISIDGEGNDSEKTSRVQKAANLFTGQDAEAQRLTAEGDALQDLQSVANVMTNAVVGASVELTFAPGESEKYLEVIPKDNTAGEGNRMFYMILGAPSGTTTNSAASTCAFTIIDNEEQEPAEVNFSSATYKHVPGEDSVTVTVKRSGAMNSVVSTKVKTTGKGSAKAGRDYSEVDTELVFPFGVDHLTVTIPVRTEYLKGKGDFTLALEPDAGCEAGKTDKTTVTLKGTYSDKASMLSIQSADQTEMRASAAQTEAASLTSASTSLTKNNLSTYKTLDSVDISKPRFSHAYVRTEWGETYSESKNYYEASTRSWLMTFIGDWEGDGCDCVYVIYDLTKKIEEGLFFSGAEVEWDRSNACSRKATFKTAIGGKAWNDYWGTWSPFGEWMDAANRLPDYWYPYDSSRDFYHEVRKMYPSKVAVQKSRYGGDHPMGIEIINIGGCDECSTLRVQSVKPILRPFQVNVKNADPLKYLQEDGTYAADTKAIGAEIVDGGNSAVFFMNDNVTVRATTEVGVTQYGYLSRLDLLSGEDEKTPLGTIAENDDPAENSITYQLEPESLYRVLTSNGFDAKKANFDVWRSMLRENKYAAKDDGYATYALFNVKPSYSYMDSSVKLRNPYDFPVTMTVSGTDYTLDAGETREVTAPNGGRIHKGDTIAVSKIALGKAGGGLYTPVGVRYSGKFQSTDIKATEGTFDFVDNKSIYISGNGDRRLNFSEIVVEPNLQEKDNQIIVRVKTADLSKFDTKSESAGFLKQAGTEEDDYTYFTYADKDATINGRLYAITATPTDSDNVAVWYDRNTHRKYEGNTLYFTAGGEQSRNMIDLWIDRSRSSVTLQGSLNYTNYNLRTGFAGNTSQVPAVGATLAAGSTGGMANNEGFITAGPIPSSSLSDRYLRYIVSVNGNDQVREILLPSGQTDNVKVDISDSFSAGVSPVTSEIFRNTGISAEMTNNAYQVDGGQIPTILGESVDMSVSIKPTTYTYSYFGKDGKLIEKEEDEYPVSVQFIVYDKNDVFRGTYEPVSVENAKFDRRTRAYRFDSRLDFADPPQSMPLLDDNGDPVLDENGDPVYVLAGDDGKPVLDENGDPVKADQAFGLVPQPGDKLYLRLTTDLMLQTDGLSEKDEKQITDYRYTDIYTGYSFYQPTNYEVPVPVGLETPIKVEYGDLPFIGETGMDLAFPFVSVGIMKINHGYRMYFGVSPVQIADTVKGTHVASMSGAGGSYWKSIFKVSDPFGTFAQGIKEAKESIDNIREMNKELAANGEKTTAGDLGSPSWKFDLSIGMYFDFLYADVNQEDKDAGTYFELSGLGGYVSVTLGFQTAWYIIIPVVFIPAYLGIEMQGTVMGYLGADLNKDVSVTYDGSRNGSQKISDGINSLDGGIRGYGFVQISAGVGLCGTLGIRFAGKANMIANWEPSDPHGDYGFFISLSAGGIIDLFLFSIPLMYTFPGWPFGTFEYYSKPETNVYTSDKNNVNTLSLREGSGSDSRWTGNRAMLQGAFRPNKEKVQKLADNAYERPDSQLITLSDGKTLVLAFIDSDNSKGAAQRTSLKMSVYHADTGRWDDPVVVSADKTADFDPAIAEMKDGRVLVTWVSGSEDKELDTKEQQTDYLNSMEVYAAFIELDKNNHIRQKGGVADTEVTQISNDKVPSYDSSPTVICDDKTGDAMILYLKSDRISLGDGDITDYINPYTNDCAVTYMLFNAEEDVDKMKGKEDRIVPEGWLFNNFYYGEFYGIEESEQWLIDEYGGQRFLDSPTFTSSETDEDGNRVVKRYAIPDFAAVSDNGMAIYSYTVDKDGVSDTDADKELYLHVYDFSSHGTLYKIQLTDDEISDTMPQFFRSAVYADSGDERAHTKLFWYKNGDQVGYIDVDELLEKGVNPNGTLKTETNGGERGRVYTHEADGRTIYEFTEPRPVYMLKNDSNGSAQSPDFKAVEDAKGNLYVLWTEGVSDGNGNISQEIFGTGQVAQKIVTAEGEEHCFLTGWSKPYQITRDGFCNDEMTAAMSGDNLIAVHNRFSEKLADVPEGKEYNGQVDFDPIEISDIDLVSDTLEPCGSVETEAITVTQNGLAVTHPKAGDDVSVDVVVANNGMNAAQGYKLSVYGGDEKSVYKDDAKTELNTDDSLKIGEIEVNDDPILANQETNCSFDYKVPSDTDGLTFWAVAQEMKDAENKIYYADKDEFISEPLAMEAVYQISDASTYQKEDGFHANFTVTNTGNKASSSDDEVEVQLWGPADLGEQYDGESGKLYSKSVSLGIGESKKYDVPVGITSEMMKDFGFVTARIDVNREVSETVGEDVYKNNKFLSNFEYVDFDLVTPMNMALEDVTVAVDETEDISLRMDLGDLFRGGDAVTYTVGDPTIAAVENGKITGINNGKTTICATHNATGATVSADVTVTGERKIPDFELSPAAMDLLEGTADKINFSTPHSGDITYSSSDDTIAEVDADGNVKAIAEGKATITATLTTETDTYTASCDVNVVTRAAAEAVTRLIEALPEQSGVVTKDRAAIEKARKAYDGLAGVQKALIPEDVIRKLEDAEQAIKYWDQYAAAKSAASALRVKGVKVTPSTAKKASVTWKTVNADIRGYEIRYSTSRNFKNDLKTIKISNPKTLRKTIRRLKAGKLYYLRVRTVTKVTNKLTGEAVNVNGKWSNTKRFRAMPKMVIRTAKSRKGGKAVIKWKRRLYINGCQIRYSTDRKFAKNVKTVRITKAARTKATIRKLKAGKTYYVQVRAIKKMKKKNGKTYNVYGRWSAAKKLKTKK